MAFSKGKRIEDETSKRIIDLAVSIGCKEGAGALTVTRLCRELNCDRRVIYNRFRDIGEVNLLVAGRCNEELIKKAEAAKKEGASYSDRILSGIAAAFACIYERGEHFQHYAALYEVGEDGVKNLFLQHLENMLEEGRAQGDFCASADCRRTAESLWLLLTGSSRMLAGNTGRKYQDALETVKYGVSAVCKALR